MRRRRRRILYDRGRPVQTVYIRQRWKYLFSEHDRDLVRDKRAWVHGGFMGILCDYPYSDAYKIYMTAADCNELEKSQVLHPSLQAVKSWMYDGHMVWLARQRDWCDRVVAVVGDLTNIWTDNSSSVSTLPLPNRADGQSCRVEKFSQFCKVLNLGSREIAWASGMNFPILPSFWWRAQIQSFQGSPVEVLASLLVPPVTPEIEVKLLLLHFQFAHVYPCGPCVHDFNPWPWLATSFLLWKLSFEGEEYTCGGTGAGGNGLCAQVGRLFNYSSLQLEYFQPEEARRMESVVFCRLAWSQLCLDSSLCHPPPCHQWHPAASKASDPGQSQGGGEGVGPASLPGTGHSSQLGHFSRCRSGRVDQRDPQEALAQVWGDQQPSCKASCWAKGERDSEEAEHQGTQLGDSLCLQDQAAGSRFHSRESARHPSLREEHREGRVGVGCGGDVCRRREDQVCFARPRLRDQPGDLPWHGPDRLEAFDACHPHRWWDRALLPLSPHSRLQPGRDGRRRWPSRLQHNHQERPWCHPETRLCLAKQIPDVFADEGTMAYLTCFAGNILVEERDFIQCCVFSGGWDSTGFKLPHGHASGFISSFSILWARDILETIFQGVFCVGVKEGQDLVKKDKHLIGGKSDPYVVLKVGESKVSFQVKFWIRKTWLKKLLLNVTNANSFGSGPVCGLRCEPSLELRGTFPGGTTQWSHSATWGTFKQSFILSFSVAPYFLQRISPSALLPALFAKQVFWSFRCLTLMLALTTTFLVKPHWKCQRWWRMDLLRFPSLSIETHCDGVESCLWNVKLFWRRTGSHWKRRNTEPSTWSVFGDPS